MNLFCIASDDSSDYDSDDDNAPKTLEVQNQTAPSDNTVPGLLTFAHLNPLQGYVEKWSLFSQSEMGSQSWRKQFNIY